MDKVEHNQLNETKAKVYAVKQALDSVSYYANLSPVKVNDKGLAMLCESTKKDIINQLDDLDKQYQKVTSKLRERCSQ